jgi:hypothetical protein
LIREWEGLWANRVGTPLCFPRLLAQGRDLVYHSKEKGARDFGPAMWGHHTAPPSGRSGRGALTTRSMREWEGFWANRVGTPLCFPRLWRDLDHSV